MPERAAVFGGDRVEARRKFKSDNGFERTARGDQHGFALAGAIVDESVTTKVDVQLGQRLLDQPTPCDPVNAVASFDVASRYAHFAQRLLPGRLYVAAFVERSAALIFDNQLQAEESPFQLIDVVGPIHRSMFPAMRRSLFQGDNNAVLACQARPPALAGRERKFEFSIDKTQDS